MYHDIPIDDLTTIITNHNLFAELKNEIKMKSITKYLKLTNRD
jgi:hypothetical protein